MKRRGALCAAANDDEDLGSLFKAPRTKIHADRAAHESQHKELAEVHVQKRTKEFAWMESDEEEEAPPAAPSDSAKQEDPEVDNSEPVDLMVLDQVQSFGRMMLLAPNLRRKLQAVASEGLAGGALDPAEVAAACRALARTKFFDAELLEDLGAAMRRLLRECEMDVQQVNDVIKCLWALNAYEKSVFSAVAAAFKSRIIGLDAALRVAWLEVYKGFGHADDPDFMQLLEVPPEPPTSARYLKVRCRFFERGCCALDKACSFAHDLRAPLFLDNDTLGSMRAKPVVMTHNQKNMGLPGTYGV
mmetsp:Transcript_44826/g.81778  ORF Transcript_44826/g.81778 Transcript_44826/m.81778 type:complete len:302 (-) Transcript_44826:88-993(-)